MYETIQQESSEAEGQHRIMCRLHSVFVVPSSLPLAAHASELLPRLCCVHVIAALLHWEAVAVEQYLPGSHNTDNLNVKPFADQNTGCAA